MRTMLLRFLRTLSVPALFMILLLHASAGYADKGVSMGLDLGIRDFIGTDTGRAFDPGPGAAMHMQVGLTDVIAIQLGMQGSLHSGRGLQNTQTAGTSVVLGGMNTGFEFDLMPHALVQPVIDTGIGIYRIGSNSFMMGSSQNANATSAVTWGVSAGTGLDYFVTRDVSIGVRVSYLFMPIPVVINGSSQTLDGSNIFAGIDISYHFDFTGRGMGMMMPMGCMGGDRHGDKTTGAGNTMGRTTGH